MNCSVPISAWLVVWLYLPECVLQTVVGCPHKQTCYDPQTPSCWLIYLHLLRFEGEANYPTKMIWLSTLVVFKNLSSRANTSVPSCSQISPNWCKACGGHSNTTNAQHNIFVMNVDGDCRHGASQEGLPWVKVRHEQVFTQVDVMF